MWLWHQNLFLFWYKRYIHKQFHSRFFSSNKSRCDNVTSIHSYFDTKDDPETNNFQVSSSNKARYDYVTSIHSYFDTKERCSLSNYISGFFPQINLGMITMNNLHFMLFFLQISLGVIVSPVFILILIQKMFHNQTYFRLFFFK